MCDVCATKPLSGDKDIAERRQINVKSVGILTSINAREARKRKRAILVASFRSSLSAFNSLPVLFIFPSVLSTKS